MEETLTNLDNRGKAPSARGETRRVLTISAGASHSVALLCNAPVATLSVHLLMAVRRMSISLLSSLEAQIGPNVLRFCSSFE